ncbi:LuxR C-terminal-related transcriptional regulator [Adlercreutzia mucosicola]|uniref:LuxR C-terminal-related transcriptional regulator n=1 Tax=Adlercreutzia mucosicola TaxID=580026 RepID=UPI002B247510|nr:LuxR C-terminal-related transcriptional regulator [Adlercreutzia mucosicola]MEB1813432.1 LuxR family transcriptional regulator [Adlercreutzia mucosicola]
MFLLLTRGRNRAFIRKELGIGDETVKSHVKAVYRKFEVHSQQELINLVEEERGEGEGRRRAVGELGVAFLGVRR